MTLKTLIIRAEGALVETEDVRRAAFARVFGEAGFAWNHARDAFAKSAAFGSSATRMAHYVRESLKGRPETSELRHLITAMQRRSSKVFADLLGQGRANPRPFVRDAILGARAEGMKVVIAAALQEAEVKRLLESLFASRVPDLVDVVRPAELSGTPNDDPELYAAVRDRIDCKPCDALVIEATPAGAVAAGDLGFPVIVTRSACVAPDASFPTGIIVLESLGDVVGAGGRLAFEPLSVDGREELLAALVSLYRGNGLAPSASRWSNNMRVSDILKGKGADVRTIEIDATVRALASGLRSSGVGAMPVVDKAGRLRGMISERDLARGLADHGGDLSKLTVLDLMTRTVVTCHPDDSVINVANVMTQRRIRHLPVVVDGKIAGLISIGDVLKSRLDEMTLEANVLRDAVLTRR